MAQKLLKRTPRKVAPGRAVSTKPPLVGSRVPRDRTGRAARPLAAAVLVGTLESLRLDDGLADCDEEPGLGPQFADLLLHEGECPLHESAP